MRAFLFPGQGSQAIGMGQELDQTFPEAREVFQEINDSLGQNLSKLMFNGDLKELTRTSNAQPALMAVSMACVRVLEKQSGKPLSQLGQIAAGHSLGEYSALCAGETFSIAQAARLLRIRGDAMQASVPEGLGGMTALIGGSLENLKGLLELCRHGQVLELANDNAPGQLVVSGHLQALERLEAEAKNYEFKRAVRLNVSAPFHSSLMQPAADAMRSALEATGKLNVPNIEVIANVSALPYDHADDIIPNLVDQVTGQVRWVECIKAIAARQVSTFVELGSGKVLTGLLKRIVPEAQCINIERPQDIDLFLCKNAA